MNLMQVALMGCTSIVGDNIEQWLSCWGTPAKARESFAFVTVNR